jgi:hypothetical protein
MRNGPTDRPIDTAPMRKLLATTSLGPNRSALRDHQRADDREETAA